MSKMVINVKPSDNIFKELGNNTYNYDDLLAEFIDNSIAAKYSDNIVNIEIEVGYSKHNKMVDHIIIKDDAKGISPTILPKAISPAGLSGGNTLNEHGLGMKQAIAALGDLEYLKTKTEDIDYEMKVNEFKFGSIEVEKNYDVNYRSGTEIKISNVSALVPYAIQSYTTGVIPKLGAMYRRYLRPNNRQANIKFIVKNIDKNQKGEYIDKEPNIRIVEELKPIYFHPNRRINEPIVVKKKFSGRGWEAKLTFGYAPTELQYKELGIEKPKRYDPYAVSLNKQGLDIIRNDRVIKLHQLMEIGLVSTKHNRYNYIRGEIDLIQGFTTAITKNNIIEDNNFKDLINKIKAFLDEKALLDKKTYPDEIPERLLQVRMKDYFENTTIKAMKKNDIKLEYAIEGLGGYIDILADGEAWELKNCKASGLDVYQLFAYMDMGDIKSGYLLADDFTTGAESAAKFIKDKHGKDIDLILLKEFPIEHAPNPEELKKYY